MKLKDLVKLKPIIEAIERGETIQTCSKVSEVFWIELNYLDDEILSDMIQKPNQFRVQPKPREWYLDKKTMKVLPTLNNWGTTLILAESGSDIIKVREVIK